MRKYLRVFIQSIKNVFGSLANFRADLLFNLIIGIGWAFISILMVEVLFLHVDTFAGWTKTDVLLLIFTFTITTEILSSFSHGIHDVGWLVRSGSLDPFLMRPIDPQWHILFGRPDILSLLFGFANVSPYAIIILTQGNPLYWKGLPLYLVLVISGSIIYLAMKSIVVTLNFWWYKIDNVNLLLYNIVSIGKNPLSIYPKQWQALLYTALPIAFIALVPADVLRGNINDIHVYGSMLTALISTIIARLFWLFAITRYSGASS